MLIKNKRLSQIYSPQINKLLYILTKVHINRLIISFEFDRIIKIRMNITLQNHEQHISKLFYLHPLLYDQLKQREMEYINLIRDLHLENNRLRSLLTQNGLADPHSKQPLQPPANANLKVDLQDANKIQSSRNFNIVYGTPEFLSLRESKHEVKQITIKNQQFDKVTSQRFSFADGPAERNISNQTSNSQLKMLEMLESDPYFSTELRKLFSHFLQSASRPSSQQYINQTNTRHNQHLFKNTNEKGPKQEVQGIFKQHNTIDRVNGDRLWKMQTKKSIKDDSRSSYRSGQGYDYCDAVSQYSVVCQSPKNVVRKKDQVALGAGLQQQKKGNMLQMEQMGSNERDERSRIKNRQNEQTVRQKWRQSADIHKHNHNNNNNHSHKHKNEAITKKVKTNSNRNQMINNKVYL